MNAQDKPGAAPDTTSRTVSIVEPLPDSEAAKLWQSLDIWPGSVAVLIQTGSRFVVHYEGGIYERKRDEEPTDSQRDAWAKRAAGRAFESYPTRAHFYLLRQDHIDSLQIVGEVDDRYYVRWFEEPGQPEEYRKIFPDPATFDHEKLIRFARTTQAILYLDGTEEELWIDAEKPWSSDTFESIKSAMEVFGLSPIARQAVEEDVEDGREYAGELCFVCGRPVCYDGPNSEGRFVCPACQADPAQFLDAACHGFMCPRKGVPARELPDDADPFVIYDGELYCPDCGGTDVS